METKTTIILGHTFHYDESGRLQTTPVQFEAQGKKFEIKIVEEWEHKQRSWSFKRSTGRASVNGAFEPPFPANDADEREWKKWRREATKSEAEVLAAGFAAMNIDISFRFSQTAGCSCGCSPGFILTGGPVAGWFDFWVNEVVEEKEVPNRFALMEE